MLRVEGGKKPHTERSEIKIERKKLPHGKFHVALLIHYNSLRF
jgi:hypothetical protein